MKKLDLLIIKSWIGPFILTFFIALFVLVMQFLWKYIDELAGKGLEFSILLELLFLASATLVPLALPLALLLSSIMTMGNFAEHLETVAAKSAGISLLRSLRSLMIIAIGMAVVAFIFANNVMPIASYQLKALLISIQKKKPAIDIPEGEFYDGIKGLIVYIGHKSPDQRSFYNVVISDHSKEGTGNSTIIAAKEGSLAITDDGSFMKFKLMDGTRYMEKNFYGNREKGLPHFREKFEEQEVIIDLRELKFNRQDANFIRNQYSMMDIFQLNQVYQKTKNDYIKTTQDYARNIVQNYSFNVRDASAPFNENSVIDALAINASSGIGEQVASAVNDPSFIKRNIPAAKFEGQTLPDVYTPDEKKEITLLAKEGANKGKEKAKDLIGQQKSTETTLARNSIEYHKKISLSFACILLFFIGAPLGAIIRKGGLGFPVIFSIVIFILYYVISTVGEKSVRNLHMTPIQGMWLSSIILFPFGIFLTLKASTDSPLFVGETYTNLFKKIFGKRKR